MASLKKFTDDLLNDVNQYIIATNEEQEDALKIAEAVVIKALASIKKLKAFIDNYKFKTNKEEIEFFSVSEKSFRIVGFDYLTDYFNREI